MHRDPRDACDSPGAPGAGNVDDVVAAIMVMHAIKNS
jgi:hypothetical protein